MAMRRLGRQSRESDEKALLLCVGEVQGDADRVSTRDVCTRWLPSTGDSSEYLASAMGLPSSSGAALESFLRLSR